MILGFAHEEADFIQGASITHPYIPFLVSEGFDFYIDEGFSNYPGIHPSWFPETSDIVIEGLWGEECLDSLTGLG